MGEQWPVQLGSLEMTQRSKRACRGSKLALWDSWPATTEPTKTAFRLIQRQNSVTGANWYIGAVQISTGLINAACCTLRRNKLVSCRSSAAPSPMNFCRANKDFRDKVGQSPLWGQCQSNVQHNETSYLLQYPLYCLALLCNCFAVLFYKHMHAQEVDFHKQKSLDSCWTPYFTTAESSCRTAFDGSISSLL